MNRKEEANNTDTSPQGHVHELQGSVRTAELNDPHGHRFCTVTGEAIPAGDDHVHEAAFITDFYDGHYHEFRGRTGVAIPVSGDRHIHFLKAATGINDNHNHEFSAATMINNPAGRNQVRGTSFYKEQYPYNEQYLYDEEELYGDDSYLYREDNYHRY